jgi:tetratricopeptide (TPR) repeat protein
VSTIRFFGIICFSASLFLTRAHAQFPSGPEISVLGEVRSHGDTGSNAYLIELYDPRTHSVVQRVPVQRGQFELANVPVGSYAVRLVTAAGETPLVEQFQQFEPGTALLVLDLPERSTSKPPTGSVPLRDLEHPIPKKALREASEAEQFVLAHDLPKAIAKLESAIRIYPAYRDAHVNLGVQYYRVGRGADARSEFQKALEIGPPAAQIYVDLALTSLASGQPQEAEALARKALELEPANGGAQKVLQSTLNH